MSEWSKFSHAIIAYQRQRDEFKQYLLGQDIEIHRQKKSASEEKK
jgi:hypothetical protein